MKGNIWEMKNIKLCFKWANILNDQKTIIVIEQNLKDPKLKTYIAAMRETVETKLVHSLS